MEFKLNQNYPNPFGKAIPSGNPSTTIKYNISSSVISTEGRNLGDSSPNYVGIRNDNVNVTLKVYDILGREVAILVNEEKRPGNYEVKFNSLSAAGRQGLSSGVYYYKITAGSFSQTRKMILVQ